MRNGGIGKGWHESLPEDDFHILSLALLKDKLTEVFNMIKDRHNERLDSKS